MAKDKMFRWQNIAMILFGIVLNIGLAKLTLALGLPLFLDSIGTLLISATSGLLSGVVVGFASNCLNSINDPITLYYGIISILLAITASMLSRRGLFKRLGTALLCALAFAFVGGGLGSMLTWALYGMNLGQGVSAPLALYLHHAVGLGDFLAQLTADLWIDIADKLVSTLAVFALLRWLPKTWMAELPNGYLYCGVARDEREDLAQDERYYRNFSLHTKLLAIIVGTSIVLSVLGVAISYALYQRNTVDRYSELGTAAAQMASHVVPPELVASILDGTVPQAEYAQIEKRLEDIRSSFSDIRFVYVYQIRPDGCHVVFDLDTEDVPGVEAGEVVTIDESFRRVLPKLLAGEPIEPLVTNDSYGWLLSAYEPVYDADGACVAYAAADIAMSDVISDRLIFIIRMVSLFFGVSTLIAAFAFWFAENKIVRPINKLALAAAKFAYESDEQRRQNCQELQELRIHTGDEIENLYHAITKTTSDASDYIDEIKDKNAQVASKAHAISQLQDNMIISFANMVENRDENTGGHIRRTAAYVRAIAGEMRREGLFADELTDAYIDNLVKSAPLHDIGKIRVPDAILNKPGKLTPEEYEVIKRHTTNGREILLNVYDGVEDEHDLSMASLMAAYHHERWDGKGYPDGLQGNAIPLCARIMSVADVLDALTSKRSYKDAYAFDRAFAIIEECAGTQFDAKVVAAAARIRGEMEKIAAQSER